MNATTANKYGTGKLRSKDLDDFAFRGKLKFEMELLIVFAPPILIAFCFGFWRGSVYGRRKENRAWEQEVMPSFHEMQTQRDALWRSTVSKTQKLRRLQRLGKSLE